MGPLDSTLLQLCIGTGVLGAFGLVLSKIRNQSIPPLPPGPKSYPLIGNMLSLPRSYEHKGFAELGRQLRSDIISLSFFGITIVVTNSQEHAIELLEKRSAIYSDRMCPPAVRETTLMNWGNVISLIGYNDTWRKYRRMMHLWMNKQAIPAFHESQQSQARLLLQRLLMKCESSRSSEELNMELYTTISSTLLQSIYGYSPQGWNDPYVVEMQEIIFNLGKAALPTNYWVNMVPALVYTPDWFPGTSWKKTLLQWGKQKTRVSDSLLRWTKSRMNLGNDNVSIVASLLNSADQWGTEEKELDSIIGEVAVGLFGAGTETTADTIIIFIMAMMLFPNAQAKAQEEIDMVIGASRLPSLADEMSLPYVGRLIQELLRWQPIAPLALPHVCTEDNLYRGYLIPKGAIVIGNIWAISRNEHIYKDPETFDPDRYLDPSVPLPPAFGWGRRKCAGLHYAEASLFIAIASILATFNITMCKNGAGDNMVPTTEGMEGHVLY
ncbi:cytochrome P450 family protein [Ceratobasidium sp. AG-Ba]|nr:cytochrome P450 family protein [Ceratobasidium sp. AG-Ba]